MQNRERKLRQHPHAESSSSVRCSARSVRKCTDVPWSGRRVFGISRYPQMAIQPCTCEAAWTSRSAIQTIWDGAFSSKIFNPGLLGLNSTKTSHPQRPQSFVGVSPLIFSRTAVLGPRIPTKRVYTRERTRYLFCQEHAVRCSRRIYSVIIPFQAIAFIVAASHLPSSSRKPHISISQMQRVRVQRQRIRSSV